MTALDLTRNQQLRDHLRNNRQDWCQHVDHRFEFGNHLDVIELVSTYQINLSVATIRAKCGSYNYQNAISPGTLVQIILPITTRCMDELMSIEISDSKNCSAFVVHPNNSKPPSDSARIVDVSVIAPVGQIFSISIIEKRSWERGKSARGKDDIELEFPQDHASTTNYSAISLEHNIKIDILNTGNSTGWKKSLEMVTISTNSDAIFDHKVRLSLAVRYKSTIMMMYVTLLVLLIAAVVESFSIGRTILSLAALFGLVFTLWRYSRTNSFEASFFRFGKL